MHTCLYPELFQSIVEYGEGLPVSTYGDVYSLGITLIEMFTGRCPTDDMFRDGLTLQYFAEAAGLSGNVMEIADSNIWLHDEAKDSTNTENITRAKECLAAIIQLGVLCSNNCLEKECLQVTLLQRCMLSEMPTSVISD